MSIVTIRNLYREHPQLQKIEKWIKSGHEKHLLVQQLYASARYVTLSNIFLHTKQHMLVVLDNADDASYCFGDLRTLLSDEDVFFFPSIYKTKSRHRQNDPANEIARTETLNRLANNPLPCIIVSYPEAIMDLVVDSQQLRISTLPFKVGQIQSIDLLQEELFSHGFQKVDFVYEPGQYAVRGSIVDIFSFLIVSLRSSISLMVGSITAKSCIHNGCISSEAYSFISSFSYIINNKNTYKH